MNDLTTINTYEQLRDSLKGELNNIANGFVRTGYLLKVARDTELICQKGYTSVAEFAKAEYQMSKDTVSRFIDINNKYSVDGYSMELESRYKDFGYSKLAEMLTLPENIADLITPEHTREQIREIKQEIREEQNITDIEIAQEKIEATSNDNIVDILDTWLKKFLYYYFKLPEAVEKYVRLHTVIYGNRPLDGIYEVLAPSGINTIYARIPGVGKWMMSITGIDKDINIINIRDTTEKKTVTWSELKDTIESMMSEEMTAEECWEQIYGEDFQIKMSENAINAKSETDYKTITKKTEKVLEKPKNTPQNTETITQSIEIDTKPAVVESNKTKVKDNISKNEGVKKSENAINAKSETEFEDPLKHYARAYAKAILQYVTDARWQQAAYSINDLKGIVDKAIERSKVVDVPGQMSIEELGVDNETEGEE